MKKYIAFFRLRFSMGLQYRSAALAGMATQFFWGAMEILMFRAFYRSDPGSFPMTLSATCSYVWLQQAFLALFMAWMMENEIFDSIVNGNIAYELCRPVNLYSMWYARSLANRFSKAVLRCLPILVFAFFVPAPYGLMLPESPGTFLLFLFTLFAGTGVTTAFCMLVYMVSFFTISPAGIRMVAVSVVEFFAGAVIPIPFFPNGVRRVFELLPFASMQNVPLRIYSGDIPLTDAPAVMGLQVFWILTLVLAGYLLTWSGLRRAVIAGG